MYNNEYEILNCGIKLASYVKKLDKFNKSFPQNLEDRIDGWKYNSKMDRKIQSVGWFYATQDGN
jgi:hypothetical protein